MEKKGKGKKKKDKDDSDAAPAATASSVALKRKAPTKTVSIGFFPLPPYKRILAHLRWKAGSSKRVRTAAGVASSQGKVWEVDSQAEEEVLEMKTVENGFILSHFFYYLSIMFSFHVLS